MEKTIHSEFQKKLKDKFDDKFTLLNRYIDSKSNIKVKCNDCGTISEKQAVNLLYRGTCRGCFNIRHTKTHDKFVKQISDKYGNEFTILSKYTYDRNKIKVRHNKCGSEYKINASSLLQGRYCRVCGNKRLRKKFGKTKEEFISQVEALCGDEYIFLGEYINANIPSLFRHNKCGREYMVTPNSFIQGYRCRLCSYEAKRCKDLINRNIIRSMRSRIIHILQGRQKSAPTMKLIGCTRNKLREYLEGLFSEGMTWENYGKKDGWQVDHKRPCVSFNLSDPEQQKECFHYTNLQPLWASDNYKKGSMWNGKRYRGEFNALSPQETLSWPWAKTKCLSESNKGP